MTKKKKQKQKQKKQFFMFKFVVFWLMAPPIKYFQPWAPAHCIVIHLLESPKAKVLEMQES
jgi:hypothetical protein